jgi:hypothetical protein
LLPSKSGVSVQIQFPSVVAETFVRAVVVAAFQLHVGTAAVAQPSLGAISSQPSTSVRMHSDLQKLFPDRNVTEFNSP